MIIRLMEHRAVTYHSVPLVRVMGSDVEHITCKAVLRCNVAAHLRIHVGDMCFIFVHWKVEVVVPKRSLEILDTLTTISTWLA